MVGSRKRWAPHRGHAAGAGAVLQGRYRGGHRGSTAGALPQGPRLEARSGALAVHVVCATEAPRIHERVSRAGLLLLE